MFNQNVRHRTGASSNNSPIPNRTLRSHRQHGNTAVQPSPGPTHMSNHPPVTPFPPFRAPFGISPSPFTSPFVSKLATPFRYYRSRFTNSQAYPPTQPIGSNTSFTMDNGFDLQAALFSYTCALVVAFFFFWFSQTIENRFFSFICFIISLIIGCLSLYGCTLDVYTWVIIPRLHAAQVYLSNFKLGQLFPWLNAPQAPIGVVTPPRRTRRHGSPLRGGQTQNLHGGGSSGSRQPNAGIYDGRTRMENRSDLYGTRPTEKYFSPTRGRSDVIIKNTYGTSQSVEDDHRHQSETITPSSSGLLHRVNTFLWGGQQQTQQQQRPPSRRDGSSLVDHHTNVNLYRGSRSSEERQEQGTPIGSAFRQFEFSPIPNKYEQFGNTAAGKRFSPMAMSIDSERLNRSVHNTSFHFAKITDDHHHMPSAAGQPYGISSSAPLSPRRNYRENPHSTYGISHSLDSTMFHRGGSNILQPTMRGVNEQYPFAPQQRYGPSYRHPTDQNKKRASLDEHVESSLELYRALRIDEHIHNWAENMRWWLLEIVKGRTDDWELNDTNVTELFNFVYQKFEENRRELSNFRNPIQRGEFFLANTQQMHQMAEGLKAPQIIEIIQKRKYIVDAMKKICKTPKSIGYLQERLNFIRHHTNPTDLNWNGGSHWEGKDWKHCDFPTDSQLLMGMFGQFMDDFLCPAVDFTGKYLIKFKSFPHEDEMDVMVKKNCRGFTDIALVEVGRHTFELKREKVAGPYYFVIFDKEKYRSADEIVRREIENRRRRRGGMSQSSSRLKSSSSKYGAWYPQPGASNMFFAMTLFAFFIHEYMDKTIHGRSLLEQGMFLDCLST